jgi:NAD(P)-dependent dehydrogenase (short-subunit alcohol dehydrogenase family)
MTAQPVALVTGASSGIGRAIASRLAGAGYRVFGTSRSPAKATALPGVTFLPLDVADPVSVENCLALVSDQAGRLDLLVNNAGIAVMGAVEEVPMPLVQQQFEANFFGLVRVTRAALPIMRRQRSGTILNISSVVGFVPMPFGAFYSASKFAVEGLTESLRAEVAGLGIKVALIEPGFFKSDLFPESATAGGGIEDYRVVRGRVLARLRAAEAAAPPPTAVADLVLRLARERSPGLRNPIGKEKIFATLKRFLPFRMFEPQGWKYWGVTA